jgi:hypothetical protein
LSEWYVFRHDEDPLGPWSTEDVAQAILDGRLTPDVWVGAPGGPRWLRALDVPSIARLVEGEPTKPRRRDSGLRIMPGVHAREPADPAFFAGTVMMVTDDEIASSDAPVTIPNPREPAQDRDADVPTDRALPPAPSTPDPSPPPPPYFGAGPTLESAGNARRRRR